MILALDLDDTLLRTDKSISPHSIDALRRWFEAGHEVIVATGRPPRQVDAVIPDLLRTAPRIVYNGAQLIDAGTVTYRNEISIADARHVIAWTQCCRPDWVVGLEINDQLYVNRPTNKPGHWVVEDLQSVCDQPAAKVLFLFTEKRHDFAPLLDALPPTTRVLISPKFAMIQLCGHTTDKVDALQFLLQQRGLTLGEVAAIGDDVNDIEMVRMAGVGIAMGNAVDEVRAVADWIAPTNDEDGVAVAIEWLLQIAA